MSIQTINGRVFFDNFNLNASEFVYNSSNATDPDSGWIPARGDNVVIQIGLPTSRATSVTLRVEGKYLTLDRPASVTLISLAGVLPIDQLYNVTEKFDYIRVGAKTDYIEASSTVLAASPIALYVAANVVALNP